MPAADDLAAWAALFLDSYKDAAAETAADGASAAGDAQYPQLTRAAGDLLRSVDAGGVPAFVTNNLKQIAKDNGIEFAAHWTPNEIIDAIRGKAAAAAALTSAPAPGNT